MNRPEPEGPLWMRRRSPSCRRSSRTWRSAGTASTKKRRYVNTSANVHAASAETKRYIHSQMFFGGGCSMIDDDERMAAGGVGVEPRPFEYPLGARRQSWQRVQNFYNPVQCRIELAVLGPRWTTALRETLPSSETWRRGGSQDDDEIRARSRPTRSSPTGRRSRRARSPRSRRCRRRASPTAARRTTRPRARTMMTRRELDDIADVAGEVGELKDALAAQMLQISQAVARAAGADADQDGRVRADGRRQGAHERGGRRSASGSPTGEPPPGAIGAAAAGGAPRAEEQGRALRLGHAPERRRPHAAAADRLPPRRRRLRQPARRAPADARARDGGRRSRPAVAAGRRRDELGHVDRDRGVPRDHPQQRALPRALEMSKRGATRYRRWRPRSTADAPAARRRGAARVEESAHARTPSPGPPRRRAPRWRRARARVDNSTRPPAARGDGSADVLAEGHADEHRALLRKRPAQRKRLERFVRGGRRHARARAARRRVSIAQFQRTISP